MKKLLSVDRLIPNLFGCVIVLTLAWVCVLLIVNIIGAVGGAL